MTTNDNPKKKYSPALLVVAWPLIVANSFWNFQLTIDRIFLGQFSTESLAASIGVNGVFWTFMALLQQTSAYLMTFVAQYRGADDLEKVGASLWQSLYVTIFGGLVFLLLIPLAQWIFQGVGHSSGVQDLEVQYFSTLCVSALPTAVVACFSAFLTGLGHTKALILINGVGLAANVLFNYLFIFGNFGFPALGIRGAGYATALSSLTACLVCLAFVFNQRNGNLYSVRTAWRFQRELFLRYLKFALPSGLQWSLEGLAFTVFLIYVGRMENGDGALAASGIAVSLMLLAILPTIGLAQGLSVQVGQSLGEGDIKSAEKWTGAALKLALFYVSVIGLSFFFCPNFYIHFFKNANLSATWSQVEQMTPVLLKFVAVMVLFDSINLIYSFTLKGAGDTFFVSMASLVIPWPFMVIPTLYFYDKPDGLFWSWGAVVTYIGVLGFVIKLRYKNGPWRKMTVLGR